MNREIKFRAWNNLENTMVDCINWTMRHLSTNNETDFKLMQYTGLKDKNGVEIYEGDILHCIGEDCCGKKQNFKETVEYNSELCKYNIGGDWGYRGETFMDLYQFEVIGNIHENPEILN